MLLAPTRIFLRNTTKEVPRNSLRFLSGWSSIRFYTTLKMPRKLHQLAPWDPTSPATNNYSSTLPQLKGVIFDMDGTLIHPQRWMFSRMRELLKITKKVDILTHISSLPPGDREAQEALIQGVEEEAMKEMKPSAGMWELLEFLLGEEGIAVENRPKEWKQPLPLGIVTRNFEKPLSYYLTTIITKRLPHNAHTPIFSPIVDRSYTPPKPDGAPLLHVLDNWNLNSEEGKKGVLMVGDSRDDMLAARRAGVWAVLVTEDDEIVRDLTEEGLVDVYIPTLGHLVGMLKEGLKVQDGPEWVERGQKWEGGYCEDQVKVEQ